MTLMCWGQIIRGRWSSLWRVAASAVLCATVFSAALSAAETLEAVADRYRKTPNATTRAAVLRYAEVHHTDQNGALALLTLGATEDDQLQFGDALTHLKSAGKRLPELPD
jgi:hypothetical protein